MKTLNLQKFGAKDERKKLEMLCKKQANKNFDIKILAK